MNITTQLADALRELRDACAVNDEFAGTARPWERPHMDKAHAALAAYDAEPELCAELRAALRGLLEHVGRMPMPRHTLDRHSRIMAVGLAHRALGPQAPVAPSDNYAARVAQLQAEGMTTSDAQAVADAEGLDD